MNKGQVNAFYWSWDKFSMVSCFQRNSQIILTKEVPVGRANTIYLIDGCDESPCELKDSFCAESGFAFGLEVRLKVDHVERYQYSPDLLFHDIFIGSNVELAKVRKFYSLLYNINVLCLTHFLLREFNYAQEDLEYDPRIDPDLPEDRKIVDGLIARLPSSGICFPSTLFNGKYADYLNGDLFGGN